MTEEQTTSTDKIKDIRKKVIAMAAEEAVNYPDLTADPDKSLSSLFIQSCINANELGDGILIAETLRDKFLYVRSTKTWLWWNGHYWESNVEGKVRAAVEETVDVLLKEQSRISTLIGEAVKSRDDAAQKAFESIRAAIIKRITRLRSNRGLDNALKFAVSCRNPITVEAHLLDAKHYLLGTVNGTIDLRTGESRNGRPKELITRASPVSWQGLHAPAPNWERYTLEIMSDDPELVSALQRILGLALLGNSQARKFFIFYGPHGSSGKSLLFRMVQKVVGPLAGPAPAEILLDQGRARSSAAPSPEILALNGMRIVWASESTEDRSFSRDRVKWLTGNDLLTGRALNSNEFVTFQSSHTLFLITNERPSAPHHDEAFWQRVYVLPFNRSYVSSPRKEYERPARLDMDYELVPELPGILAWLVRGCLLYQESGLIYPDSVKKACELYRKEQNPLGQWTEDCVDLVNGAEETFKDLYANYSSWHEKNVNVKIPTSTKFGKWLGNQFERGALNNLRSYKGLRLK